MFLDLSVLQESLHLIEQSAIPTLIVCAASSILSTALGFCCAFFLLRPTLPFRLFFFALVVSCLAIPLHVHACHWMILLGRNGLFTASIQKIFPDFSLYSIAGAVWITGISFSPLSAIVCIFSFVHSSNTGLADQTRLYLTPAQRFFWVLLPYRIWGALLSFLLVFLLSMGEMAVCDLLGIDTLGRQIYLFLSLYYRPDMAILMSIPILFIAILVCLFFPFLLKKEKDSLPGSIPRWGNIFPQKPKKTIFWIFPLVFCMPYILSLPVLLLAIGNIQNLYHTYFSLAQEFWHSFALSIGSSFLILSLAMPLSWMVLRKLFPRNFFFLVMLWIAILPSPLTAIGVLRIFTQASDIPFVSDLFLFLRDTDAILIMGLFIRYFPFVFLVCIVGMIYLPIQLEETASLFGYSRLQQFFYVVLPFSKNVLLLAFFTGFLLCLFDLNLTLLLVPPGITTLTIRIFTLLHYGVRSDVAIASLFLIFMAFCVILAGCFIFFQVSKYSKSLSEK
ncbi:MAG: iron ABC transporter permease [Candidatus Brocadiae bacterium]|nr:iron ABC transporter permease [Candidatus Brocadiia bacterium]